MGMASMRVDGREAHSTGCQNQEQQELSRHNRAEIASLWHSMSTHKECLEAHSERSAAEMKVVFSEVEALGLQTALSELASNVRMASELLSSDDSVPASSPDLSTETLPEMECLTKSECREDKESGLEQLLK